MNISNKLKDSLSNGMKKGWGGFVWMLKIIVPISLITLLLEYSGWLSRIDFLLAPAMEVVYLPPMAALPLIVGMLTGIYGAIAAMAVLPLTYNQMTLIAIFLLISHNFIQEAIIQGKSGLHPLKSILFRITASIATVMVAAQFLGPESATTDAASIAGLSNPAFSIMMKNWGISILLLCVKIFVIIMSLMILLEIMKQFDLIEYIVGFLSPIIRTMGLHRQVSILWLTAAAFGIAYGGAAIVEEARENSFPPDELSKLHLSIGINHALIEDPALFLSLGLHPFWLWVPRLVTAVIAVYLLALWHRIRRITAFGSQKNP